MINNNENPIIDILANIFANTEVSLHQHAIMKDIYVIHLDGGIVKSQIKQLIDAGFTIRKINAHDTKSIKIFVKMEED